jgi:hypothetical protein
MKTHARVVVIGGGATDGFRASVLVEADVSAVPLPAALPLFGARLAALGLVGRR